MDNVERVREVGRQTDRQTVYKREKYRNLEVIKGQSLTVMSLSKHAHKNIQFHNVFTY